MNRQQIEEWAGTRISPRDQRYVLLALAHHCDLDTYEIAVTHTDIAEHLSMSRSSVAAAMTELIRRGLIEGRPHAHHPTKPVYRLMVEGGDKERAALTAATERITAELKRQAGEHGDWFDPTFMGGDNSGYDGYIDRRRLAAAVLELDITAWIENGGLTIAPDTTTKE